MSTSSLPPLRVMTLNLLYASGSRPANADEPGTWPQRRTCVSHVIERHTPDIIGFQEVEDEQLRDLKADLRDYDCDDGPVNGVDRMPIWARRGSPTLAGVGTILWRSGLAGAASLLATRLLLGTIWALALAPIVMTLILKRAKGRALQTGGTCPVFWKKGRFRLQEAGAFWISHRPDKPDSILLGTWLPRIVHWVRLQDCDSGTPVTVFNCHLDWWMFARSRSGKIIAGQMNRMWDNTPQLLIGDFNAPRQSATWDSLMRHIEDDGKPVLREAWQDAEQHDGPEDTYHGGDGKPGFPGRIDHILFRPQAPVSRVTTETHSCGEVFPSDHFPLVAELGKMPEVRDA